MLLGPEKGCQILISRFCKWMEMVCLHGRKILAGRLFGRVGTGTLSPILLPAIKHSTRVSFKVFKSRWTGIILAGGFNFQVFPIFPIFSTIEHHWTLKFWQYLKYWGFLGIHAISYGKDKIGLAEPKSTRAFTIGWFNIAGPKKKCLGGKKPPKLWFIPRQNWF